MMFSIINGISVGAFHIDGADGFKDNSKNLFDFRTINDLCGNIGWPILNIAQTLERIGSKKPKYWRNSI
jgi:hypothetical protein